MPATWKNKMIEQGFNYTDSTVKKKNNIFETRVVYPESQEDKKKIFCSIQEREGQK